LYVDEVKTVSAQYAAGLLAIEEPRIKKC